MNFVDEELASLDKDEHESLAQQQQQQQHKRNERFEAAVLRLLVDSEYVRSNLSFHSTNEFIHVAGAFAVGWLHLSESLLEMDAPCDSNVVDRLLSQPPLAGNATASQRSHAKHRHVGHHASASPRELFLSLWVTLLPQMERHACTDVVHLVPILFRTLSSAFQCIVLWKSFVGVPIMKYHTSGDAKSPDASSHDGSSRSWSTDTVYDTYDISVVNDGATSCIKVLNSEFCHVLEQLKGPQLTINVVVSYQYDLCLLRAAAMVRQSLPAFGVGGRMCGPRLRAEVVLLEDHVKEYMQKRCSRLQDEVLLPSLLGEKWTATSKFYAGRAPSFTVSYFHTELVATLRSMSNERSFHCHRDCDAQTQLCEHSARLHRASVGSLDRNMECDILYHSMNSFVQAYYHFTRTVTLSDIRRLQLAIDVMYIIRMVRLLAKLFAVSDFPIIEKNLLKLAAVTSLVTCSDETINVISRSQKAPIDDDDLEPKEQAPHDPVARRGSLSNSSSSPSKHQLGSPETPPSEEPIPAVLFDSAFFELVWNVTPFAQWSALLGAPVAMPTIAHCLSPQYCRFVTHAELSAISFPSPLCELPNDICQGARRGCFRLCDILSREEISEMLLLRA